MGAELTYVLNVQKAGTYEISYRLSSPEGTGVLEVYVERRRGRRQWKTAKIQETIAWIDLEDKTEIEFPRENIR